PFNGFVSEWLTFQAILSGPSLPQWALKFGVPVVGAALALAAALAAACFVKAFGVTFLGRPRTPVAAGAKEVDIQMIAAMALLAGFCVALGLVPQGAIVMLSHVTDDLFGGPDPATLAAQSGGLSTWLFLSPLGEGRSSYSGLIVLAVVTLVTTVVVFGVHS